MYLNFKCNINQAKIQINKDYLRFKISFRDSIRIFIATKDHGHVSLSLAMCVAQSQSLSNKGNIKGF